MDRPMRDHPLLTLERSGQSSDKVLRPQRPCPSSPTPTQDRAGLLITQLFLDACDLFPKVSCRTQENTHGFSVCFYGENRLCHWLSRCHHPILWSSRIDGPSLRFCSQSSSLAKISGGGSKGKQPPRGGGST